MVAGGGIELEDLCFRIGDFAIPGLSLTVRDGEYFVLTGPNGAGKTLLIMLIAGLHRPLSGDIRIKGRVVTRLPPWKRNIGYVPQDGLLFPNRTVRRNIAFGLEVRRASENTIAEQVGRMGEMLGIAHILDRMPHGLSGGERQKVSLARALVLEPAVLLLDEPVSAIDEGARDGLCRDIRSIQRRLGITTLHVSHNQRETELVADRVGLLAGGELKGVAEVPASRSG